MGALYSQFRTARHCTGSKSKESKVSICAFQVRSALFHLGKVTPRGFLFIWCPLRLLQELDLFHGREVLVRILMFPGACFTRYRCVVRRKDFMRKCRKVNLRSQEEETRKLSSEDTGFLKSKHSRIITSFASSRKATKY